MNVTRGKSNVKIPNMFLIQIDFLQEIKKPLKTLTKGKTKHFKAMLMEPFSCYNIHDALNIFE